MPNSKRRALPPLLPVSEIKSRLNLLFPEEFPDRSILTGNAASRVLFVFLYGGFIEPEGRFLRPSFIYFFTDEQADQQGDEARLRWAGNALRPGFRPAGLRWYADNSRETIRDDLMRNQLVRLGVVGRRPGVPTTSSQPIYCLSITFATLFDPQLKDDQLAEAMAIWRKAHLSEASQSRMRLRAARLGADATDVLVNMPDGSRVRVSAGPSSLILKGIVEHFAPRYLDQPAVLWISASDKKIHPQFVEAAAVVGLKFQPNAELPDLILADLGDPVRFVFCEIVATDGAVTEARKADLLKIIRASNVPEARVEFLTAFEDREAGPFRKNFGALAGDGMAWFRTEPELLVRLTRFR